MIETIPYEICERFITAAKPSMDIIALAILAGLGMGIGITVLCVGLFNQDKEARAKRERVYDMLVDLLQKKEGKK